MVFENKQIYSADLPQVKNTELIPINSKYLKVIIFNHGLTAILLLVVAGVILAIDSNLRTPIIITSILMGVFLIIGISYFLSYLSFKNRAYAIREHDLIFQTGWFNKTLTVYPISRIQYCGVQSNLFERKLGLHRVSIYTAGGDGADTEIMGLPLETAEKIKQFILDKIKYQDAEAES